MPNSNISMCVTSCDRQEFLQKTLETFYTVTDIEPQELIICEDSAAPMPEFLRDPLWRQRNLIWLSNEGRKGQIYSADRLMKEVKHDYVFWCEDDWSFERGDFMAKSKALLDTYPNIIQVSLRGDTGWHPLESHPDFPFMLAEPGWRDVWGGWSFNPGLRRLSDYQRIGSFGKHVGYGTHGLGHESHLSKMLLDAGYLIADLGKPYVRHIGESCSRAIEPLPELPKVLIAIPACFKLSYTRWESDDSPHYNQATAWEGRGYGTGIHISGDNDRIAAVRNTWAKDLAAFPNVTLKFFYGKPEGGYPREPLPDEVFMPIPDDYAHLPQKTIEIARYAVREKYDFVLKADDDTYVWVDRLIHELLTYRFDYAGWDNNGVASGGPGYWLSNRAARLVATNENPDVWAEDCWVGRVMAQNGVRLFFLPTHLPGHHNHFFDLNNIPSNAVTIHAVDPSHMRELYWREHAD